MSGVRSRRARTPASSTCRHTSTATRSRRATRCSSGRTTCTWGSICASSGRCSRTMRRTCCCWPMRTTRRSPARSASARRCCSTRSATKRIRPTRSRYGGSSHMRNACGCATPCPLRASLICATTTTRATSAWTARCCSPATTSCETRRRAGSARPPSPARCCCFAAANPPRRARCSASRPRWAPTWGSRFAGCRGVTAERSPSWERSPRRFPAATRSACTSCSTKSRTLRSSSPTRTISP